MYRIINNLDIFENMLLEILNDSKSNLVHKPTHDIIENDDEYVIEVYLPGVKKNDVFTEVNKNELAITAERKVNKDVKYIREQSFKGKYELKFTLGEIIDKENIDALFADGILKITIPKQKEKKKSDVKKIEIK